MELDNYLTRIPASQGFFELDSRGVPTAIPRLACYDGEGVAYHVHEAWGGGSYLARTAVQLHWHGTRSWRIRVEKVSVV